VLLPVQKQFSRRSEGDERGDDQLVSQRDHLGEQSLSAQLENTFAHLIAAHRVASGCLWRGGRNALRCVASCGPGSQVILTYVHSGILDGSVCFEDGDRLLRDIAHLDERWTFSSQREPQERLLRGERKHNRRGGTARFGFHTCRPVKKSW